MFFDLSEGTAIFSAIATAVFGLYKAIRIVAGDDREHLERAIRPEPLAPPLPPEREDIVTIWRLPCEVSSNQGFHISINGVPAIPTNAICYEPLGVVNGTPVYRGPFSGIEQMSKSPFTNTPATSPVIKPQPAPEPKPVHSPFKTLTPLQQSPTTIQEAKPLTSTAPVVPAPTHSVSPLSKSTAVAIPGVDLTKEMIDKLGREVSGHVSDTTNKIIKSMTVDRFGELGQSLTLVTLEAQNLDPDSFSRGVMGWFRKQFTDVRALLVERLESGQQVFDTLKKNLENQIQKQEQWIIDLNLLYADNIAHEKAIATTLKQAKEWKRFVESAYNSYPAIDPNDDDAMQRVQEKRDLEVKLNRLRQKVDTFEKLRALAQSNAPKVIGQQTACENIIDTLRDTIDQTIPMIERAFAEYLADLDIQKAGTQVSAVRDLGDATIRKSADASYKSSTDAARQANETIIKNDTLKYIQSKMLATVRDVRQIETDANTRRETDARDLKQAQAAFITEVGQTVNAGQLASNRK